MKARCVDPTRTYYAGRGIRVCEEWQQFAGFLRDMGERPPGHTLDRKDPDLGYYKANCRWATPAMQVRNRRCTKLSDTAVQTIKRLHAQGQTQAAVAKLFSISQSMVSMIVNNRTWRTV